MSSTQPGSGSSSEWSHDKKGGRDRIIASENSTSLTLRSLPDVTPKEDIATRENTRRS